jgi:hypothetical protein
VAFFGTPPVFQTRLIADNFPSTSRHGKTVEMAGLMVRQRPIHIVS